MQFADALQQPLVINVLMNEYPEPESGGMSLDRDTAHREIGLGFLPVPPKDVGGRRNVRSAE
jgi:hypothetical protein